MTPPSRIHSLLSPKCEVRPSPVEGLGVFAVAPIRRGELVAHWGGKVYTAAEVEELAESHPHFVTHPISLSEGYYLGSTSLTECDPAEMFNHSCAANAGVKGQVLLVARRPIAVGDEVSFDYDTTEVQAVPFTCRCGAAGCRGVIDGRAWRDPVFQAANRGWLSWYIGRKVRRLQRRKPAEPDAAPDPAP